MVATDYNGLGTLGPYGYLVGNQAGRAVLDAVRAARQLSELDLANQTVVWGHSQGGGAAIIKGYSETYPDVRFNDYIRPTARIVTQEWLAVVWLSRKFLPQSAVEDKLCKR